MQRLLLTILCCGAAMRIALAQTDAPLERFQSDTQWGYRRTDGTITLPAVYDELPADLLEFTPVRQGGQYAVVTPRGEVWIAAGQYDHISMVRGFSIAGRDSDGLLRIRDVDQARLFVRTKGLTGVTDPHGRLILPCQYVQIRYFKSGYLAALDGAKWYLFDMNGGKALREGFDVIGQGDDGSIWVSQDGLQGLYKMPEGRMILPMEYDAITKDPANFYVYKIQKGSKTGIFDTQSGEIKWEGTTQDTPIRLERVEGLSAAFQRVENRSTRRYGLQHTSLGQIMPTSFELIMGLGDGRGILVGQGANKALFDTLGRQLTGFEYDIIAHNHKSESLLVARRVSQQDYCLLDWSGKPVSAERYDRIFSLGNGYFSATDAASAMAIIGPDGQRLTPHKYFSINTIQNSKAAFRAMQEDGSEVCLDAKGAIIACD
jgi:WG containing repeat